MRHCSFRVSCHIAPQAILRPQLVASASGIANTATARQLQNEAPARRHELPALGPQPGTVIESSDARYAVLAAVAPSWRMKRSIEHRRKIEFMAGGRLDLDDLAQTAGTIAYEILTGLSSRLERRYVEGGV